MKLSDRSNNVEESKTVRFTPLIERLKRDGKSVVNFAVGEPEYTTSKAVIEKTKKALDFGYTRYGAVAGLPELRTGIASFYGGYDRENIIISNGSKQSLFLVFQVILDPGDEVIIPIPCWVSFSEQVKMAGGRPVFTMTQSHQLDIEGMRRLVTDRTRAIIINSPNNPTGVVYNEQDVQKVLELALERDLFVISDEAYGFFVYDGLLPKSLFGMIEDRHRLIITGSFSKQYNMTGFRVGYVAANPQLVAAITKYQGHVSGNVCTFAQYGALAALGTEPSVLSAQKADLEKKRNTAWQSISKLFDCVRPQGAFYIFPSVREFLKENETDSDFAASLLQETGVAVVPGEAFGMPGHIRISYAVDEELLVEGLARIGSYMRSKY